MIDRHPRPLHAGAWWLWALGLAAVASQTNNPLLLGMVIAVASLVVAARAPAEPWARGYRTYLVVAGIVVAIRVVFRLVLGGGLGDHLLVALPQLPLPGWAGGITIGGPVTAESLLAGLYDGLRLAALLVCVGAANTLADPRRLLRAAPRALGGLATSAAVALSLAPQLVETVQRVRRARRLRGDDGRGFAVIRSLIAPILEDTLNRSLAMAASMDSRGYARGTGAPAGINLATIVAWIGLAGICLAGFTLLSGAWAPPVAGGLLAVGLVAAVAALGRRGRASVRTRYRPDPWGAPEWTLVSGAVLATLGVTAAGSRLPGLLHPTLEPLAWPIADPLALAAIGLAGMAAWATPSPDPARSRLTPIGATP